MSEFRDCSEVKVVDLVEKRFCLSSYLLDLLPLAHSRASHTNPLDCPRALGFRFHIDLRCLGRQARPYSSTSARSIA